MAVDAILSLLSLFLYILLYILLGIVIVGGTLAVAGLCTGIFVGAPAYPLLQRLPTVRQPFSRATESLTGNSRINLKNKMFLVLYVGSIGFYSVVYLILLAQVASALWDGYSYWEHYSTLLVIAGVLVIGLFTVANSGSIRRLEPPFQPILEWGVFVAYVTALCTVTIPQVFILVVASLSIVL